MREKNIKIITFVLMLMLVISVFAGCNSDASGISSRKNSDISSNESSQNSDSEESSSKASTLTKEEKQLIKDSEVDPGADVSFGKDQQGNTTFNYKNPDGTGGGGVVLD